MNPPARQSSASIGITRNARIWIILGASLSAAIAFSFVPPIPQPESYHRFADQRAFLGISNCLNTISNLPFLMVGLMGLIWLASRKYAAAFVDRRERWPYDLFFSGVLATAFGSAWYHLAPDDARLVWDRLPIAVSFMGFLSAMICERISVRAGLGFLFPLVILGAGSVFYWLATESLGRGDLRPYLFVQFFPLVLVLLLFTLFPARYTEANYLLLALVLYALAKVCEVFDARLFSLGHVVSGHTLKHLLAAWASYWPLHMLRRRTSVVGG